MSEHETEAQTQEAEIQEGPQSEFTPEADSDDNVTVAWDVTIQPDNSIAIHFDVKPKDEKNAVTSVTASFVVSRNGQVLDSLAGSRTANSRNPADGQGLTGNMGVDTTVFSPIKPPDIHEAILAGTVRVGEDEANFFFTKVLPRIDEAAEN